MPLSKNVSFGADDASTSVTAIRDWNYLRRSSQAVIFRLISLVHRPDLDRYR